MLKISVVLLLVVVVAVGGSSRVSRAVVSLDVDTEEAKEVADKAVHHINQKLPGHFHHKLLKISEAEKLTNLEEYHLTLIVGETTCIKQEVTYEEAKQCDIKEGARAYKKCKVISPMKEESTLMFACRKISESEI